LLGSIFRLQINIKQNPPFSDSYGVTVTDAIYPCLYVSKTRPSSATLTSRQHSLITLFYLYNLNAQVADLLKHLPRSD
ncbi:hypothetical protein, partial [Merismopedia glauca]|uniref:hypothetical protein n=1 Tax=Merismopedia glauca TaxID=292586 RepID=UPI0030DB77BA